MSSQPDTLAFSFGVSGHFVTPPLLLTDPAVLINIRTGIVFSDPDEPDEPEEHYKEVTVRQLSRDGPHQPTIPSY